MKRQFSRKSREERYFYAVCSTKEIQGDVNFPGKQRKTRPFFEKRARKVGNAEDGKTQHFFGKIVRIFVKLWEGGESPMETLISRQESSNLHKG